MCYRVIRKFVLFLFTIDCLGLDCIRWFSVVDSLIFDWCATAYTRKKSNCWLISSGWISVSKLGYDDYVLLNGWTSKGIKTNGKNWSFQSLMPLTSRFLSNDVGKTEGHPMGSSDVITVEVLFGYFLRGIQLWDCAALWIASLHHSVEAFKNKRFIVDHHAELGVSINTSLKLGKELEGYFELLIGFESNSRTFKWVTCSNEFVWLTVNENSLMEMAFIKWYHMPVLLRENSW